MHHAILRGDARRLPLPDRSIHCCVTSPPYFNLRDYQSEGQIGLEKTPEEFVASLVRVFREVKRVLRDDGTLFLNIGDSYFGGGYSNHAINGEGWKSRMNGDKRRTRQQGLKRDNPRMKPKDLIGIPWMLAFALRDDGWYLRSDIVWSKPNPMRESVRDRPTKSHEYLFLLSKKPRYFCDMEAIKDPSAPSSRSRMTQDVESQAGSTRAHAGGKTNGNMKTVGDFDTANKLSVWTVPTRGYKGAHFATFPPKLIVPCIKAGTSEKGCCRGCGAPWRRIVEKVRVATRPGVGSNVHGRSAAEIGNRDPARHVTKTRTIGWESSCGCLAAREPIPCTVLDPFGGASTTALVAASLGRSSVGVELNPEYAAMGRDRLAAALLYLHRPHRPRPARKPRARPPAGLPLLFD